MSNLSTSLPSVTGYDSVGDTEPADKEAGTTWYDTSVPTGKVYTGSQWVEESAPAGGSGITLSGGQYDVATSDGLTISSGAVALLLSGYLTIDGNGDLAIASGSIGPDRLTFDPATQTALDNHAGDSSAHHSRYSDSDAQSAATTTLATGTVSAGYHATWGWVAGYNGNYGVYIGEPSNDPPVIYETTEKCHVSMHSDTDAKYDYSVVKHD